MSCPGDNWAVPSANPCASGGGGGLVGVLSLNSVTGNMNIVAGNGMGVATQGANIVLTATGLEAVNSLNGFSGVLDIVAGNNTSVESIDNTIAINVSLPDKIVNTINTYDGDITLNAGSNISITNGLGNNITIAGNNNVSTINGMYGEVFLTAGSNITFETADNNITINGAAGGGGGGTGNISTIQVISRGSNGDIVIAETDGPIIRFVNLENSGIVANPIYFAHNSFNFLELSNTGVHSLNNLSTNVSLTAGSNITFDTIGNDIRINGAATGNGTGNISTIKVASRGSNGDIVFAETDGPSITFVNLENSGIVATPIYFAHNSLNVLELSNTGVHSLNNLSTNVTLTAGTGIEFETVGNNITITNNGTSSSGVTSLNGLSSIVTLSSSNGSITVTPNSSNIDLIANFPNRVTSLNTLSTAVTLASDSITFTPDTVTNTINMVVTFPEPPPSGVTKINDLTGEFNFQNGIDTDIQVTATATGHDIQINGNSVLINTVLPIWSAFNSSIQNVSAPNQVLILSDYLYHPDTSLALSGTFTVNEGGIYKITIRGRAQSFQGGTSGSISLVINWNTAEAYTIDNMNANSAITTSIPYFIALLADTTITCVSGPTFGGNGGVISDYYICIELHRYFYS